MRAPRGLAAPLVLCVLAGCGGERERIPALPPPTASDSTAARRDTLRPIETVQEAHTPALMAVEGVVGTYVGATEDGKPCIKVMVVRMTPDLETRLPKQLEGYPVELVESGEIRPLPDRRP